MPELGDHAFAHAWSTRLDLLRLAAVEDRVEADLLLGGHGAVVDELRDLVAAEPLRERLWAQLMLALYRCGRQAEALRAYGEVRRLFREEMGLDPGPDLRRLESAILAQAPELDWHPDPAGMDAAPLAAPRWDCPFVGRDDELGRLVERLGDASAGRGSVALIRGEPGVGKTRLAQELAAVATARQARAAWGQASEDGGAGAYEPWAQVLRPWLGAPGSPGPFSALKGSHPELAQLFSETGHEPAGDGPVEGRDSASARLRLFDAVVATLLTLAAERPTVVVLDDLQWAERASLLLLRHVARRVPTARFLVVAAYRDVGLRRDHPLTVLLGELAREAAIERVAVTGLAPMDVGRIIELATGVPPGRLAEVVHDRTGGNPFFVREVVRLLQSEDRLLHADAADDLGIPDGVREVVDRRCAALSTAAHQLLGLAAVAGRAFEAATVESLWEGAEPALDLLDEAEAAGLVVADPVEVGRYRFSHDIVREAVYDGLSPLRRARLHGRIGRFLTTAAAGRRSEAAPAQHLLLGIAGGVDPRDAAVVAWNAAAAATASLAYDEAVSWCEKALQALDGAGQAAGPLYVKVLLSLGDARWRAGDVPGAREAFLDAAARSHDIREDGLLARALLGFGGGALRSWHATRGTYGERPVRLLQEALGRLGERDSAHRAQLLGMLAEELYYTPAQKRPEEPVVRRWTWHGGSPIPAPSPPP